MDTKPDKTDYLVSLGKGIVGAAPFVGPLVAELIGTFIPNQRLDRIAKFVEILEKKIADLDQEQVRTRFRDPDFVDLLEDGFYQATRALTDERKEHIASIIKNGLSDEQFERVQYKKILSLLSELNDVETIILQGYSYSGHGEGEEFFQRHEDTVKGPLATMESSQEEVDKATIYKTYRPHLMRLGLLRPQYTGLKKGELPEFDKNTGTFKTSSYTLTPLGRLLLRLIDLTE